MPCVRERKRAVHADLWQSNVRRQYHRCVVERGEQRGNEVKPNIWFDNGRWHVYARGWPVHGYLLRESAYAYAKAVWERENRD